MFFLALRFFFKRRRKPMKAGQKRDGNTALYAMLLVAAVEMILDSTRYDSSFFPFNGFVSVGQIGAAVCVLSALIVWSVRSVRANGRTALRHGDWYLGCYAVMAVGCFFMAWLPVQMYKSICAKKQRQRSEA